MSLADALWLLIGAVLGSSTLYIFRSRRAPRARLIIECAGRVLVDVPVAQLPYLALYHGGTWSPFAVVPWARAVTSIKVDQPIDIRVEASR